LRTLTKTQRVAALGTLVVTLSWLTSPADPVLRIDGVDGGGEGGVFGDLQDTANPPVQDRTAVQLQGGDRFFCTVMDNAQIKCWGNNLSSQLGTADNYRFHGTDVSNMGATWATTCPSCSSAPVVRPSRCPPVCATRAQSSTTAA
jgi:hypothetical protein